MSSMERKGSISSTCSDSSAEETRDGVGKKIKIPVTVPKPFSFTLYSRLQQRRDFDDDLRKRQHAAEERDRISRERQEREEELELKKYRKSLNFKANPIRSYSGIYPNPSEKELTIPQGPRLLTENRLRTNPEDNPRADSRGSSDHSDIVYSTYSYNGPTVL
ncbi:uncharacterized protein LOC135344029 [Halichondria panicea]|uniref:uncharacterized protein LOC135344029 n=1 Tax=Halichondria panicea TaxID=6063 RepID=UPI00312B9AC6